MPYRLEVIHGIPLGKSFVLDRGEVRIGRDPANEIVIPSDNVSRRHARLVFLDDAYFVEDQQSRNHTFVNGQRVEGCQRLEPHDRIAVGGTVLEYRYAAAPPDGDGESPVTVLYAVDAVPAGDTHPEGRSPDGNAEAKLRAVLQIGRSMGRTLDLHTLLHQMLDSLFEVFPQADRGLVVLRHGDELDAEAVRARNGADDSRAFSRTIANHVLGRRQAVLSEDAIRDSRFGPSRSVAELNLSSVICAPILAADLQALGIVQLEARDARARFTAEALEILLSVANQMALSVEYAQLHERLMGQAELQTELTLAAQLQQALLPKDLPAAPGYEFWAYYSAAPGVGGDFYDFLPLPGGNLAVLLGDVCGKGIPAALMMARVSSICQSALLSHPHDVVDALLAVNVGLLRIGNMRFLTLAACVLNPTTHELAVASAGHPAPLICRANGEVEESVPLAARGYPLGISENFACQAASTVLRRGEVLLLYSDGISEAFSPGGEMYSTERVVRLLPRIQGLGADRIGQHVVSDLNAHAAGAEQHDDVSLVVICRQ